MNDSSKLIEVIDNSKDPKRALEIALQIIEEHLSKKNDIMISNPLQNVGALFLYTLFF